MAMNPVDHPNGGGQGKSKGGGGRQQVVSPWGQLAKGSRPAGVASHPTASSSSAPTDYRPAAKKK